MGEKGGETGFYGKLPGLGDFVTRRLGRDFVEPWDGWLQGGIAASRAALGDDWLDIYLTSPLWRFVLGAGVCGACARAGLMMPSVDRVGRYFPLTIVASLSTGASAFGLLAGEGDWFEAVEALALSTLDEERPFALDEFDAAVNGLGSPAPAADGTDSVTVLPVLGERPVRLGLAGLAHVANALPPLLDALTAARLGPFSLWWTGGSDEVEASVLLSPGLPPADGFASLLDGQWGDGVWEDWSRRTADDPTPVPEQGT